ncbi:MAG: PilZ domain-containing protein [Thiogranum sp.]
MTNTSLNAEISEQRRKRRVTIPGHPQILDAYSGNILGQLVNLSVDGLMSVSPAGINCGTVCQVRIPLLVGDQSVEIQLGIESLWCEDANESGAHWSGFQIIDISPEHQEILNSIVGD